MRMLRHFLILGFPAFVPAAGAQIFDMDHREKGGPSRVVGGFGLMAAVPQGEFADQVGTGYGFGANVVLPFGRSSPVGIRLDAGFLIYGHERKRVCFSSTVGCRVELDLNTNNNIFVAGIGPQLMLPKGAVRPYLTGSVGLAYLFTESSVEGSSDLSPFANTTNYDDLTFAWTGAAGIYIPVRRGRQPISIDLSARYHANGRADYLREGSIRDNPDGSISVTPIHSETNFWTWQLGLAFGFGTPGNRE